MSSNKILKGAFYTPKIWSNISKEYLAKAFGFDWTANYYVWDCACGDGSLVNDLIKKDRVFASDIATDEIAKVQLPDANKFHFDFVNDDWLPISQGGKIPSPLWDIITNHQDKLIIYMNPPFVNVSGHNNKNGASRIEAMNTKTKELMANYGLKKVANQLFMQFYFRIHYQMPKCKIGAFTTLLNTPEKQPFMQWFELTRRFRGGFLSRSRTWGLKGDFPIAFYVWDTDA